MSKTPATRGGPRKSNPLSSAERMRAYRQRKRSAGFRETSQWVSAVPVDEGYSDHRILDARSLALHCMIARKMSRDPGLLETPRRNLQRWSQDGAGPPPGYIREWQQILAKPMPEILSFITGVSDDAVRLRQSSPCAGVLSPRERKQVYDAFRA